MNTFCIGRLFIAKCGQAAGSPLIDRGVTTEVHSPWRRAACLVIRAPFRKHRPCNAIAIGWWKA